MTTHSDSTSSVHPAWVQDYADYVSPKEAQALRDEHGRQWHRDLERYGWEFVASRHGSQIDEANISPAVDDERVAGRLLGNPPTLAVHLTWCYACGKWVQAEGVFCPCGEPVEEV